MFLSFIKRHLVAKVLKQNNNNYYSHILKPLFLIGLILGLTPICNLSNSSRSAFKWFKPQTFYSISILALMTWASVQIVIAYYYELADGVMSINNAVTHLFTPMLYLSCVLTNVQCLFVTRKLTKLLNNWDQVSLNIITNGTHKSIPKHQITILIVILLVSSGIEIGLKRVWEWSEIPVNDVFSILQGYTIVVNTYHDVIISILAMALKFNFDALAKHVKLQTEMTMMNNARRKWRISRENHLGLAHLTNEIDHTLSFMVLQSYVFNVFFLCIHVSLVLKTIMKNDWQLGFLLYSIFHLSLKTCVVSASVSSVNQLAHAPLEYLFDCPSSFYGEEVCRFICHLTRNNIGFTGGQLFLVDRKIFLAVLSMIITYELVLLKLN